MSNKKWDNLLNKKNHFNIKNFPTLCGHSLKIAHGIKFTLKIISAMDHDLGPQYHPWCSKHSNVTPHLTHMPKFAYAWPMLRLISPNMACRDQIQIPWIQNIGFCTKLCPYPQETYHSFQTLNHNNIKPKGQTLCIMGMCDA